MTIEEYQKEKDHIRGIKLCPYSGEIDHEINLNELIDSVRNQERFNIIKEIENLYSIVENRKMSGIMAVLDLLTEEQKDQQQ